MEKSLILQEFNGVRLRNHSAKQALERQLWQFIHATWLTSFLRAGQKTPSISIPL